MCSFLLARSPPFENLGIPYGTYLPRYLATGLLSLTFTNIKCQRWAVSICIKRTVSCDFLPPFYHEKVPLGHMTYVQSAF